MPTRFLQLRSGQSTQNRVWLQSRRVAELARFIVRFRWVWLVLWPSAAAAIFLSAPRIPTLLADSDRGFLPADLPSQKALALLRTEFPEHAPASRAAIVAVREPALSEDDHAAVDRLALHLESQKNRQNWRVTAEVLSPYLRSLLRSSDGAAAVIAVNLPAELLTHHTVNRVREIQRIIGDAPLPAGLRIDVTGSAALGELLEANTKRHIGQTKVWTLVSVTLILLLIYRSPAAMLLPIVTVASALGVSLGLIGWGAAAGLPINGLLEVFIVVLLGGCGVDYCLLLFARFQEEWLKGGNQRDAVSRALEKVAASIGLGAATIVAGLFALVVARNRDLLTSGPTIAFAVAVVTAATLTLTPSLMIASGRFLLWPRKVLSLENGGLWRFVAEWVVKRPRTVSLWVLAALVVPAAMAWSAVPTYDAMDEFPRDSSYVRGARAYYRHFHAAESVSELTVLILSAEPIDEADRRARLLATLGRMYEDVRQSMPVVYWRDGGDPLGERHIGRSRDDGQALSSSVLLTSAAAPFFIGKSRKCARVDFGLRVDPRSGAAFDLLPRLRGAVEQAFRETPWNESVVAAIAGESAMYADIRLLRARDFRWVAVVATLALGLILAGLTRSGVQAAILIGSTLLVYLAAYGLTTEIFRLGFGLSGLNWHVDFLLFIIVLSLGQDYNIFVVTRYRECRKTMGPREAVRHAVERTGRVISSCGLIMAASFGSMFAGSVMVMKQSAVALAIGILLDTYLVRPLLVPALILLLEDRHSSRGLILSERVGPPPVSIAEGNAER